jgi:ubiquinone/menaquinone biosynthesis C-methylase UbiE/8-oxo-dGTP pyrophosphatase MutT (NUDIX family)
MDRLLSHKSVLVEHIQRVLHETSRRDGYLSGRLEKEAQASAVLLLLGWDGDRAGHKSTPCLILNKRSGKVRQPGDLCCPGGSMDPWLDRFISRFLSWPALPLGRWPKWSWWLSHRRKEARRLALCCATALRESFEEMRLNPFRVTFLGCLPPQRLALFKRMIYPAVGWIEGQRRFFPNWEVERIVRIPIAELLKADNYARYRLQFNFSTHAARATADEFPCFIHRGKNGSERLWGATFRIAMDFLNLAFGFQPPDLENLPLVTGQLQDDYLNRSKGQASGSLLERFEPSGKFSEARRTQSVRWRGSMLNHFDRIAPFYDRLIRMIWLDKLIELLDLPKNGVLLDAGGGTGRVSAHLAHLTGKVLVSDISHPMLLQTRHKPGLLALRAHAERLPLAAGSVDRILVVDALHHFCDQKQALGDLVRVLRPGGRMVIEEPDIARWIVKFLALFEKLARMQSRFLSAEQIMALLPQAGLKASWESDGKLICWVVVDKKRIEADREL